jgi:hypothetical protein
VEQGQGRVGGCLLMYNICCCARPVRELIHIPFSCSIVSQWPCCGDLGDGWEGVQWHAVQMWRMYALLLLLAMRLLVYSMATPQSVLRSTG